MTEYCNFCNGLGNLSDGSLCSSCGGRGRKAVYQPAAAKSSSEPGASGGAGCLQQLGCGLFIVIVGSALMTGPRNKDPEPNRNVPPVQNSQEQPPKPVERNPEGPKVTPEQKPSSLPQVKPPEPKPEPKPPEPKPEELKRPEFKPEEPKR